MNDVLERIAAKKNALEALRARKPHGLENLEHSHDIEITYTSNAIEGNTLSAAETTLVIEKGITIAGRPLRDHLEALDHYDALRYVRSIAYEDQPPGEGDIRNLHRLIMLRSQPDIAGRYADQGRFVLTDTGRFAFPSPVEVPALMGDFANWLAARSFDAATAFEAHRRLVEIHPFNDGNGRTARLLMNLILLRGRLPAVSIRPVDRPAYIAALQESQSGMGSKAFDALLYARLESVLDEVLATLESAIARPRA